MLKLTIRPFVNRFRMNPDSEEGIPQGKQANCFACGPTEPLSSRKGPQDREKRAIMFKDNFIEETGGLKGDSI